MAARLNTIVAIAMLALYDEFDTYWQNGGYKKISDIIFAECHIFIVSNLCYSYASFRLKFQISTCARAYSLRAVWPAEEVAVLGKKTELHL